MVAGPFEHIDDVTKFVDGATNVFTVLRPPYIPGTVRVFINGKLTCSTDDDGWNELDPNLGTVQLKETPLIDSGHAFQTKDTVHVLYQSFVAPFPDRTIPKHIIELRAGDIVKIAMRAGYHINPIPTANGPPRGRSPRKGESADGFSRTVFFGYITKNTPVNGFLDLAIQKRRNTPREHLDGRVLYKNILYIYITLSDVQPLIETAPISHPGAIAKGTLRRPRAPTLIRVRV